jgi:mannose-6-phosphate isomerase-like protein (cupin superfamily)
MIEQVINNDKVLSIIIRSNYHSNGIEFFTPDDYSQQLAYMNREEGYVIPPHLHNSVQRQVHFTQEVLYIKSGKVRVDFYDNNKNYLESKILNSGDVILLAYGGHGFQMIEESEIIEIKQGPYVGDNDKTRFNPVNSEDLIIT